MTNTLAKQHYPYLTLYLSHTERMSRNFFAKTGFMILTLGAIATGSFLNACSTVAQNQAQTSSPTATDAGAKQMDHGSMQHGGMSHSASMELGPADAEYDLRFIDAMIPHHRGAIDMANEALQKSKRTEIKSLAQNIIKAQNREENELMRKWRKAWYPNAGDTSIAYNSQMGHSMPMSAEQKNSMMMKMDLGAADDQFDLRFLNAMIPHHEGAVMMAKDALNKAKHPELKQLANEIIASQQTEINQMKQWKQAWYKQ